MSHTMTTLVASRVIPARHKMVLYSIAQRANKDRECWPSVGLIAADASCSERQVYYSLKWLEEQHLITRTTRTVAHGGKGSSLYRIVEDVLETLPKCVDQTVRKRAKRSRRSASVAGTTADSAGGGSHTCSSSCTDCTTFKNQSLNQSVEPWEYFVLPTEAKNASVIEINFTTGERMRYEVDEGPEVENPFAQRAAERVGRNERSVSRWNWSDVAKDFGAESSRFYPMVPGRTNTAAVASVLKRESIKSGLTPELAVAMTDAFFWDRRHIVDGVHIWKQFLSALPRLQARAEATISLPRVERQGHPDAEPVQERSTFDPFAAQRAWLIRYGLDPALADSDVEDAG